MAGDTLLTIDGKPVLSLDDVRSLVKNGASKKPLKLIREGKEIERMVEFQVKQP